MNREYIDWEIYVGRLIVSFGEIELLTYKLFDLWVTDKKACDYTLGERLNKLIGYVENLSDTSNEKARIKELLIRARRLNEIRHQVAHNPTILKKINESKFEILLEDLRGKREPLSIEQLHEYADDVVSVKSSLFVMVSQYTNKGINELIT
jgi:hypothetical protein